MHFSAHQTYAAQPERVHRLLTNETFLATVAEQMGAIRHRVASTPSRAAVEATVESPSPVRSFVGSTLTLLLETVWADAQADGTRAGTVSITIEGTPASAAGVLQLSPAPQGSTLAYDGDLTVRVPLVGPAIEKAATPAIQDALAAQERAAHQWLEENPG